MAFLTEDQRGQLAEDGVCIVPNALSRAELDRVNAGLAHGGALENARVVNGAQPTLRWLVRT